MIKKILLKLPDNLRKYIFIAFSITALISLIVLIFSFSFAAFFCIMAMSLLVVFSYLLLDILRGKTKNKKIKYASIIMSFVMLVSSAFVFFKELKSADGFNEIFSREENVQSSKELLGLKSGQNVLLEINPKAVFESSFKVEKIISEKRSETENVSSVWDGDEWIDSVILDREILYVYCVFLFDEKYFVAKISPNIVEEIKANKGNITISAYVSKTAKSEMNVCNSICEDVTKIIFPVDHFEGEEQKDFYDDMKKISGESSVLVISEDRNLLLERTVISVSLISFLAGIICILLSILHYDGKVK